MPSIGGKTMSLVPDLFHWQQLVYRKHFIGTLPINNNRKEGIFLSFTLFNKLHPVAGELILTAVSAHFSGILVFKGLGSGRVLYGFLSSLHLKI